MPEEVVGLTAQQRYTQLETDRKPYEQRAREAAELTIPSLLPPEGATSATQLPTPFQSLGARGVNNLAAKLLLALFPPGGSFFRLSVDEFVLDKELQQAGAEEMKQDLEAALAKVERAVMNRMEQTNSRSRLFECLKHLVVTGNGLLQVKKGGQLKFHSLTRYVVKRDLAGTVIEVVLKEGIAKSALPPAALAIYEAKADDDKKKSDNIDIYTWIKLDDGKWTVHQEIVGTKIPGTDGSYPKDKPAFLALRWIAVDGEDYGRGHVEEYMGDLRSLEGLSQALVEFAAVASKIVFLVDEAGTTDKQELQDLPSGGIGDGNAKDITVVQAEKYADFSVTKATLDGVEKRMEQAFLLNSSVQRQAERVTAEEVRYMAGELEQALGGVYSVFAQELQYPLVVRYMAVLQKEGKLPALPDKTVTPKIVTGLEGLGRSSDLMKLDLFVSGLNQTFPPEAAAEYINIGEYGRRRATALGIDPAGLLRTDEEVQASRQQQQQSEMAQAMGPTAIGALNEQQMAAQDRAAASPS
jgi:hypothetical protein